MRREDILDKEEQIRAWIGEGRSKAYICMQLHCKPETLSAYLAKLGIDYRGNRGRRGYPRTAQSKPAAAYLYKGSTIATHDLKLKLIKDGLKLPRCESCCLQTWLNSKIPLELHHLNGDRYDNRLENLQILCPNCHALTENHAGKAIGKRIPSKPEISQITSEIDINHRPVTVLAFESPEHYVEWQKAHIGLQQLIEQGHQPKLVHKRETCLLCNKQLAGLGQDTYCSTKCAQLACRKITRPSEEELEKLIWQVPTSQLARQLGVSDVAIAKWCKSYGIAKPPRGYWAKQNSLSTKKTR